MQAGVDSTLPSWLGEVGGRLRTGEGSWREFPTKVEDDYHRWESDPRFREWMINDLYRPVIGEAEVDAWRRAHAKRRH